MVVTYILLPICYLFLEWNDCVMTKSVLTDAKIRALKPVSNKQLDISDEKIPGFGIRVSPKGTKTFSLVYRFDARQRRLNLGRYPILSLSEARKAAQAALREVSLGTDPACEKEKHKNDDFEFKNFVDQFIEDYAKRRNKSWRETQRLLEKEFVAFWGKRDLRSIEKRDVTKILDGIVKRGSPSLANHAFAAVRKLFNWAVERDFIEVSPCTGLRAPSKFVKSDRVLSDAELIQVWHGADEMSYPYGRIVQLLILTGQRIGEVSSIEWNDIDTEDNVWNIPADRNKSGRFHRLPLSPQAFNIIKLIPRMHDVLLFPARGRDTPVSGYSKWKRKIDDLSKVNDWKIHDIRRTVATGMARAKVQPFIVERVLNHRSGEISGVAEVYNRYSYADEMREALGQWGSFVQDFTDGE